MADQQKKDAHAERAPNKIPLSEWIVALVGLILVIAVAGSLLYQIAVGDESPPDMTFSVENISENSSGYLVELVVQNDGGTSAADVMIEGELLNGDESIETSEAQLDYVPAGSQRRAGLFFTENPEEYELVLRPLGYQQP